MVKNDGLFVFPSEHLVSFVVMIYMQSIIQMMESQLFLNVMKSFQTQQL